MDFQLFSLHHPHFITRFVGWTVFFLISAFWVHTNFLAFIGMWSTLSVSYICSKSSSGSLHFLTAIFYPLLRLAVLVATICLFITGRSDHHSDLMPPLRNMYLAWIRHNRRGWPDEDGPWCLHRFCGISNRWCFFISVGTFFEEGHEALPCTG